MSGIFHQKTKKHRRRVRLSIHGRVQGVGFRPHIYRQLVHRNCAGCIQNTPQGVLLDIEGEAKTVENVVQNFAEMIPPRARIDDMEVTELAPTGEKFFAISDSSSDGDSLLPIPPDMAICRDCRRELADAADRRSGYAFNTCTCCGPRFTIAGGVPFDRINSEMDKFPLCAECRKEFTDPSNHRFHAQTMSCPRCGPHLSFFSLNENNAKAKEITGSKAAIAATAKALRDGLSVAIKGLGGFHLACDASDPQAVERIRACKRRPHKPLSVMVGGLDTARKICEFTQTAEDILSSEIAPIVLLEKTSSSFLCDSIAPGLGRLGVMLPYTPLHRLLLDHTDTPPALVMTSCNRSEEPIALNSASIQAGLSDMVDGILDHNREIHNRCDDSVVSIHSEAPVVFRRSRGYVPEPIMLQHNAPPILAVGAMWKNTFTLTRGARAYQSQHIGDVSDADNADYFEDTFRKFSGLMRIEPELIACDMHPDYPTTAFAQTLAARKGLPVVRVQHHYAHILSCMAENAESEPVIGVAMDGTGYGNDGKIWGGEFFIAGLRHYTRRFHFEYVPMPGGDKAVSQPFRMALAYLSKTIGADRAVSFMREIHDDALPLEQVAGLINNQKLSPLTSSCGRLFDAVSSLLGIRHKCSYEGQAACELEALALKGESGVYPYRIGDQQVSFTETINAIIEEMKREISVSVISARFHNTIVHAVVSLCDLIRGETGLDRVALSGGVMQNKSIHENAVLELHKLGFKTISHKTVPPNDAGLSLGQAAYVNADLSE